MIKAYYHGFEVDQVIEYRADGTVRVNQKRADGGHITINADPADIVLVEVL